MYFRLYNQLQICKYNVEILRMTIKNIFIHELCNYISLYWIYGRLEQRKFSDIRLCLAKRIEITFPTRAIRLQMRMDLCRKMKNLKMVEQ